MFHKKPNLYLKTYQVFEKLGYYNLFVIVHIHSGRTINKKFENTD